MSTGESHDSAQAMARMMEEQRIRSVLHTRRDTWATAAVMTALLLPWGIPFGIVALIFAWSSKDAINTNQFELANSRLRRARLVALVGTGIAALVWLVAWFPVMSSLQELFTEMPRTFQR